MQARANSLISRELDMVKFFQQRRMLLATALATLTPPQRRVAQNLSRMNINESSDLGDDNLNNQQTRSSISKNSEIFTS